MAQLHPCFWVGHCIMLLFEMLCFVIVVGGHVELVVGTGVAAVLFYGGSQACTLGCDCDWQGIDTR